MWEHRYPENDWFNSYQWGQPLDYAIYDCPTYQQPIHLSWRLLNKQAACDKSWKLNPLFLQGVFFTDTSAQI